ncbi:MAG: FtsX-like permease family protein [Cytophagales bacterium]|nr:FtsX-like permease family protein [Cytophagales bacterium]
MNLFFISWQYIKSRPLSNALHILILALGIAVIVFLLLASHQVEDKLMRNAKGIDLVVGSKGSPMQLILSAIFHIDYPTGNIGLEDARALVRHPLVKHSIPMALGDSYKGFRIVGTDLRYPQHYQAQLAEGNWWKEDMEAVIGSKVAQTSGLKIGDRFAGAHGMGESVGDEHAEHLYIVTGIMKPTGTVLDNLVLTNIGSVWAVHEQHSEADSSTAATLLTNRPDTLNGLPPGKAGRELTAMLIQFRNPMAAIQLPRYVNAQSRLQAASPAVEVARLFRILGVGVSIAQGFSYLIITVAGLSIFIALYNALKERRYDLAVMRALGASQQTLFALVILEGLLIAGAGSLLGIFLGHLMAESVHFLADEAEQAAFTGLMFLAKEWLIVATALLIGFLTALIPAIGAYKTDISSVLAKGE